MSQTAKIGSVGKYERTFVGNGWESDNDTRVVFVFETLSEHVHVERSEEAESTALAQCRG